MYWEGVLGGCVERVYWEGVLGGCVERMYWEGVEREREGVLDQR